MIVGSEHSFSVKPAGSNHTSNLFVRVENAGRQGTGLERFQGEIFQDPKLDRLQVSLLYTCIPSVVALGEQGECFFGWESVVLQFSVSAAHP